LDLGKVSFNPSKRDLNSLIGPLAEDRRSLAEERHLTLTVEFQPNLPPVSFDEALMVQVVSNLLTNALNYTPPGGQVWVRTMDEMAGDKCWVGFSVEDTGPGVADEEREHLFERFYRGKAGHSSGTPGTGLGLAIVKQVVNRHGGRIEVPKAEPGRGATFQVWLPAEIKETG
jgi:two-component system, OmpR family, phosphate regulon sensor histidine kinase PhoR